MEELYIPADVMPIVVSYWDMKDRAKMAMVSKKWNACLSRNVVWGMDRWIPQAGTVGAFLHLPKKARHIGSPYKACFFHWLDTQRLTLVKSARDYYHHWKQEGCPCLYIEHHMFEDTLIAPKRFASFSEPDQKYIYHRVARPEIIPSTHRYCLLVRAILQEFRYIKANLAPPQDARTSASTELYALLLKESDTLIRANRLETYSFVQTYIDRLKGCIRAIDRRGTAHWIANEIAFAKDPMAMWDSVALRLVPVAPRAPPLAPT